MRKKLLYKLIVFIITVSICCATAIPAWAEEDVAVPQFSVEFKLEGTGETYISKVWIPDIPQDSQLYLTLPHIVKDKEIAVVVSDTDHVIFDGTEIENRSSIYGLSEGKHILKVNNTEYVLNVYYTADIPTMFITTESGSMTKVFENKDYKERGYIVIMDGNDVEYKGRLSHIKGRGNATWEYSKKPFNVKLENKFDLFGMGAAKKWSLIADFNDATHLKNRLTLDLADAVGLMFSSKSEFVDLFVNGEYYGLYSLTESVEIGKNRVDIEDLEDASEKTNKDIPLDGLSLGGERGEMAYLEKGSIKYVNVPRNPEDITGGYLIENELGVRYKDDLCGFVSDYGQPIVIKSPEYASKAQVEYISDYYQQFEDAVLSDDGYNKQGKHYSEYVDIQSMAKAYVINEFTKNLDAGTTSFYYYKDKGGKLVASPVWDFDSALGRVYERNGVWMDAPEGYWATESKLHETGTDTKYTILTLLCKHRDFRREAARQWQEYFVPRIDDMINQADIMYTGIEKSAIIDKVKWNKFPVENGVSPEEYCDREYPRLIDFINRRARWMSKRFDTKYFYVQYCANGGTGIMLDIDVYIGTDVVYLPACMYYREDYSFTGWNTEADGSGQMYQPEQVAPINGDNLVLYAQWYKPTFFEKVISLISRIIN